MSSEGGGYLAALRGRRRLSLDQVVHLLATHYQIGISRSGLNRYETGARTHPDAMLLWGLAHMGHTRIATTRKFYVPVLGARLEAAGKAIEGRIGWRPKKKRTPHHAPARGRRKAS